MKDGFPWGCAHTLSNLEASKAVQCSELFAGARVWATDGSVEYSADASGNPAEAAQIGETVATAVKTQAGPSTLS